MMRSLLLALGGLALAHAISLWEPTGPYHVGYTQHIFNHTTPDDPTSPGTFMLLTIYYPTLQIPNATAPYLDAISAGIFEATIGLPARSLSRLTTRLQFQAPTLLGTSRAFANGTSPHATLVFTPGAGLPAAAYTAYLSDLASHGHAVVAIDHPGEAPYLPLPYGGFNGSAGVYGTPDFSNYPATVEEALSIVAFRASDVLAAVSDAFLPALVAQYGAPFNVTHYGVFGHSAGGAAAADVMASEEGGRLFSAGGANLDGSLIQLLLDPASGDLTDPGNVGAAPDVGSAGPFLEVGSEAHFAGNASADATWAGFNGAQRAGWLRDVQVDGSRHLDLCDIPLWIDLLDQRGKLNRTWVGPVGGGRVTAVTTALLRGLFGGVEGKGSLGEVDEWVEEAPDLRLLFEHDP